ncbi:MAG: 50S ribosomal protein L30 [Prevotellaceae bacterium]|nr:50S ribosomal protein L30 [Prevotellaceae bacterium]MCD8284809.1 50S ribosomal protein L30 [Prevotellaceae bacterium]MCD8303232.1 50S ribosomal protein L30 [Prevotellaceae bacterium]
MATIKVQQVRSRIHAPHVQKATLDTLGLRKMNHIVEIEDTPSNRGLIQTVHHLVKVLD